MITFFARAGVIAAAIAGGIAIAGAGIALAIRGVKSRYQGKEEVHEQ